MKRSLLCLILLLLPLLAAAADSDLLERVSHNYSAVQPGLDNYRVTLETNKLDDMLAKMTANMPPDMPRPTAPTLVKYWSAASGTSVIRGEGTNIFPYMQEMIGRFSEEFSIDLHGLLLPAAGAAKRAELLQQATVQTAEAAPPAVTVSLAFAAPVDLQQAFYGDGLGLPQTDVRGLSLELEPEQGILRRMVISLGSGGELAVELGHRSFDGLVRPEELRVTAADGSIDDRFATTFAKVDDYLLPQRQEHTIHRRGREETITVRFTDYRLNTTFPPAVQQALGGR